MIQAAGHTEQAAEEFKVESLVEAAKVLDAEYTQWRESNRPMTERLEEITNHCCSVMLSKAPTDDTLSLYNACLLFAREWQDLLSGAVDQGGRPNRSFWAALEDVAKQLDLVDEPEVVESRTVADVLEELGDFPNRYEQVAREFGDFKEGRGWRGPFFDRHGGVRADLIKREAEEPGCVLGEDYEPPTIKKRREAAVKQSQQRLKQLRAGMFRRDDAVSEDQATIEELVREGQYADVIAKIKRVTIDEVRSVAQGLGIELVDRDAELMEAAANIKPEDMEPDAAQAPKEPRESRRSQIAEAESDTVSDSGTPEPEEVGNLGDLDFSDDGQPQYDEIAGDDLKGWVLSHLEDSPEASQMEVMTQLATEGKTANPRAVAGLLRHHRKG